MTPPDAEVPGKAAPGPAASCTDLAGAGKLLPEGAEPFAAGRDAEVYALDERWVLRRYRNGYPVRDEADFMRHVAKFGYPVPAVREVDGADMVIERLTGPTLAEAAVAGDLDAVRLGELHADLHRRLHAIPAPSGTPGLVVVHGDLHPENVIATAAGPIVIDWRNAEEGTAEFDIAMTAVIFAQVALDPAWADLSPLLREALAAYLANSIDPSPGLAAALDARGNNITLTPAEKALLPAQEALIRGHLRR
ncbi:phosphotransferase [Kribbella sp. NBC_01505]|uniref:phosphotransferase n=1 Tax=Kribbella sp. NBC_01505 TaxID=2903580 RepID=UPI00386559E3